MTERCEHCPERARADAVLATADSAGSTIPRLIDAMIEHDTRLREFMLQSIGAHAEAQRLSIAADMAEIRTLLLTVDRRLNALDAMVRALQKRMEEDV